MYKNKRIQRVHSATKEWVERSFTYYKYEDKRREFEEKFNEAYEKGNINSALVELSLGDGAHLKNHGNLRILDHDFIGGLEYWLADIWRQYLWSVYDWNRGILRPKKDAPLSEPFGVHKLCKAYLLKQHEIVSGTAKIYAFQDGQEGYEDWMSHDYFDRTRNPIDGIYLIQKLGFRAPGMLSVEEIENDMEEYFGEYGELLTSKGEDLKEVVHSLCEEHLFEHSKKGREDTVWGLFPIRICTFLSLAGHDIKEFADVHELMSIQAGWLSRVDLAELRDPYVARAAGAMKSRGEYFLIIPQELRKDFPEYLVDG